MISHLSLTSMSDEMVKIAISGKDIRAAVALGKKNPIAPTGFIPKLKEFFGRHVSWSDPLGSGFAERVAKSRANVATAAQEAAQSKAQEAAKQLAQQQKWRASEAARPKYLPKVPEGVFQAPKPSAGARPDPYFERFNFAANPRLMT